ncbi:MAG: MFS transporter, partial [Pseudomonadota bacterium]
MSKFPVTEADQLPRWRRPESLLMLMALAMPLAFSVWMAMLNNFSHDVVGFAGEEIGAIHMFREIPGFLAFLVVYLLLFFTEQRLAMMSLILLGVGTAMTGALPTFWGLVLTTVISSIGFHYFETVF